MIDPEVKSLDHVDPLPTATDVPAMLAMTVGIGERGEEGCDNFEVVVCNPAWISEIVRNEGGLWPRATLVVEVIDPAYVKSAVQALADQFRKSHSWEQFAERLNRYLHWEFEDLDDGQGKPVLPGGPSRWLPSR